MPQVERVAVLRIEPAQMPRVGGGRRADIAALDIPEYVQALGLRVFAGHLIGVDAGGPQGFIHRDLRFDGRHDARDRVNNRAVELEICDRTLHGGDFSRVIDLVGDLLVEGVDELRRHHLVGRVEPDDAWIVRRIDRFDELVHVPSFKTL